MSADYYQIEVYQYGGAHTPIYTTPRQVATNRNPKTTINSIKRKLEQDGGQAACLPKTQSVLKCW